MQAGTPVDLSFISAMRRNLIFDGVHTVFGLTGNMDVVLKLSNGSKINKVTIQD